MRPRLSHRAARSIIVGPISQYLGRPPSLIEIQVPQSIAYMEGHYGHDYQNAEESALNWGSVHCKAPHPPCPGCFVAKDVSPKSGKRYDACFRIYATDEEGAADLVREVYRRRIVREAIPSGDSLHIADAMERSSYFKAYPKVREKRVWGYASTMHEVAEEIARHMREPLMLKPPRRAPPRTTQPAQQSNALHIGLAGLFALALLTRR